jgi:hypothetical protein
MQQSKRLWRASLFIILLAALCGSLAFPLVNAPANAAPRMQVAASIVISEFRTRGSNPGQEANDEFIELYNPTGGSIDISNWEIWGSNGNNPPGTSRRLIIDPGTVLTPGQHYLIANSTGYNNSNVLADQTYGTGITDNGGIALIDPSNPLAPIDQVGMSNNSAYKEGTFLSPLTGTSDQSYERNPGGAGGNCNDSNNNSADFLLITPSNPQNLAGPPVFCAGLETFTPTTTPTNTSTPTETGTPTSTNTPTSTSTATATSTSSGALSVIINEVAWSGTSANSDDEWIELYNPGSSPVNITGWRLYGDDGTLNNTGNPNITFSGSGTVTINPGEYFLLERNQEATDVPADWLYTGSLSNNPNGERLYLKDALGNTIDTANVDGGSWPAGTASTSTTNPPSYASMERVGTTSQWVTYAGTVPVAHDRNGGPIKGTPGSANWITSATITTITSDLPDPSLVNQNVTVSVTVIGGTTVPTGRVSITGTNSDCSITLSNGSGSCVVRFTSLGSKTITATYVGDSTHPPSSDTEAHQVSTTTVRTPTPVPSPLPPPPLLVINEFVPRPGHDWNSDGVVNVEDEYIEILNHGVVNVNLSGYSLDDEVNIGSVPYRLPSLTLRPGERIVFYGSETGLLLSDGGDGVRLLRPNGQLMDAYNYFVVGYPDQSFCRLPDNGGADDWNQNCYPTPGLQNSLSSAPRPTIGDLEELFCPIADTLPEDFARAECDPYGHDIWRAEYWDRTGWYGEKVLPGLDGRWPVFAD